MGGSGVGSMGLLRGYGTGGLSGKEVAGAGVGFVCFVWLGAKFTFELRCFTGLNLINLSRCQARR